MRGISVLFIASDARRFVAHELRRRKIGLAQSQVDSIGKSALEALADQRRLQAAHSRRQLKRRRLERFYSGAHSDSASSPSSSSRSSRTSPTSTLYSPSAC